MNESEMPAAVAPVENTEAENTPVVETQEAVPAVDPVRAAAVRLGAKRRTQLVEFGRLFEREHALTPGRQRIRQLIQLGKRYEQEHGLRAAKPRRKTRGDRWANFLAALADVVQPAYRPALARLAAALAEGKIDPPRVAA